MRPQKIKELHFARGHELGAQPQSRPLQQRDRTTPIEVALRPPLALRLQRQSFFGLHGVKRNDFAAPASFQGLKIPMRPVQVMIGRLQQEGAKPAGVRSGPGNAVPPQQVGEQSLSQVTGSLRVVATSPDVRVERKPIGLAQKRKRRVRRLAGLPLPRPAHREDNTPMGGGERHLPLRLAGSVVIHAWSPSVW
jgi:hypothetical protein